MNDNEDPAIGRSRRNGRALAGVAFAVLGGLLTFQMLHHAPAALGAAVSAGVVATLLWGRLVVRPGGVAWGGAVAVGFAATFAAFCGAAAFGLGGARVAGDEAAAVALFALLMVLPVMLAAAVGVAALTRAR